MDQRHVGPAVKWLSHRIGQVLNNIPAVRENKDLTGIQVWILNFLFRRGETATFQRDVEAEFNVRRSTATEILKQMERGGLIRRVKHCMDRLNAWLSGGIGSIPELEEELLLPFGQKEGCPIAYNYYNCLYTVNVT